MEAKKIIQSGYSIILYKILNVIRRDDDGDCDIDCCATFEYEYYDNFLITYMPFDKLDNYMPFDKLDKYNMRGLFYITFYEKYDMNLIKESMLDVHLIWKKDVEDILQKCDNKWVVKVEDGILNLKNTLSLCDSENLLMKPVNDNTFMTLFYIPNYFDYNRIAEIVPHHLIENFIIHEKVFYDYLQQNNYRIQDEEGQMRRLIKSGHQNHYVFDDTFTTLLTPSSIIERSPYRISTKPYIRDDMDKIVTKPYTRDDMDKIVLVKAYAHMADKIINQDFNYTCNKDYKIKFIKNENKKNSYFVIMEFTKSFTLEMIMKSIYYINNSIEEKFGRDWEDLLEVVNDFTFMKPIHNKLLFSHICCYSMDGGLDISLKDIYENEEFILDEEVYDEKKGHDNYHMHEFINNSTIVIDHKNISFL